MKKFFSVLAVVITPSVFAKTNCNSSAFEQSWPYQGWLGKDFIIAGSIDAQASIFADCNSAVFSASAAAKGYVFKNEIHLAETDLSFGVNTSSQKWLNAELNVLGFELDGVNLLHDEPLEWNDSYFLPLNIGDQIPYSFGPIGFALEYGVSGIVGLDLAASFKGLALEGAGIPTVQADTFASAGLKAWALEFKVRGDVLLVDEILSTNAGLNLEETEDDTRLNYKLNVNNKFEALNGKITLGSYSSWFKNKLWETKLFSWNGFNLNNDLINLDGSISLTEMNDPDLQYFSETRDFNVNQSSYKSIVNEKSNLCLDISGGQMRSHATVIQWLCEDKSWQKWSYNGDSGLIRSMHDPRFCLAAETGATNGSNLVIAKCRDKDNQKFSISEEGYIAMQSMPDQVIDGFGHELGDNVGIWSNWEGANQRWKLVL